MKSKNFDSILFFKLGKFYELYHMDAMVGTKELSVAYMKVNIIMSHRLTIIQLFVTSISK